MPGLLQTHRPEVALPTFRTPARPPTYRPPAYKSVPGARGHRTTLPDVSISTNMVVHEGKDRIGRILDRIHSLDDLSADDVVELRRISECSLAISKFKVSPDEYRNWLDKVGVRGVEYDAQNACIVLKEHPGWMHEAATGVIYTRLFGELEDRLSAATGSCYSVTGSKDTRLAGDFDGSIKQADASLTKLDDRWPSIVLEVGISETTNKLYDDARRWLEGSKGHTKLVILVDVEEKDKRITLNDKWDLSENDFKKMSYERLSERIFQWYDSKPIRLVGSFKLSVHLWYSDGDEQCILDKAAFSTGNLIDLTTIEDVPLRLEHLMPAGSDFDASQPLLFPLKRLVQRLQDGLKHVEMDRASDLAEEAKKKDRKS